MSRARRIDDYIAENSDKVEIIIGEAWDLCVNDYITLEQYLEIVSTAREDE